MKAIIYLNIFIILGLCACNSDNESKTTDSNNIFWFKLNSHYLEDGSLESMSLENNSILSIAFFNKNMSISFIDTHYKNGNKDIITKYAYDDEFTYKLEICTIDSAIMTKKYIDNGLIFESFQVKDSATSGYINVFYVNGALMLSGKYQNGGLAYLNEFDENGNLKTTNHFYETYINKDQDGKYQIVANWFINNEIFDSTYYTYSFYRIINHSTRISLIEDNYIEQYVIGPTAYIPFDFETKGRYIFRSTIQEVKNYNNLNQLYDFYFSFDDYGNIEEVQMKPIPIEKQFFHPYSTILSMEINSNSHLERLDSINIVFRTPISEYITFKDSE